MYITYTQRMPKTSEPSPNYEVYCSACFSCSIINHMPLLIYFQLHTTYNYFFQIIFPR